MDTNELSRELSQNFIEYAVACNTDRAIPDSKSGLKPVAKRILYGAYATGRTSNKPHVKCAKIVGDVMGTWHPHGDSSIYGALVRLAQDWVLRYPLIDFHGNLGNIGGDGPAAYRYTEARLSKLSETGLLQGLKKNNVDFIPNYDETDKEPITLPAIFPNLLCNPNKGIGVAMACNWLPHNLNEVASAIYDYLDGKEPMIPGPDFPTGGTIINKNDLPIIIKKGSGSVKLRANYKIEKDRNIVIYEIPYGVSTETIIEEIGTAADENEVENISDIRDESNRKGLRIVVECDKGVNPETVIQKLFQKTSLQISISYNQVALVDKTPTELGLKDCIKIYVDHNIECIVKEARFDLDKATAREHIIRGLLRALEDIDNIIALIKKSASAAVAKTELISKYNFTEVQAKAILDMKLAKLANLEKIELEKEAEELMELMHQLSLLIEDKESQIKELKNRLSAIVEKFGDARRTQLMQLSVTKEEKEIEAVVAEDVVVVISQTGDIKRIPKKNFKTQRKNGKGIKEDKAILTSISTNTIDNLMIFTNKGLMYKLLVDNIPVGTNASKGVNIHSLVKMGADEKISAATSLNRKSNPEFVVFVTKQGMVKKTCLSEYMNTKRTTGIVAIKVKDGDSIIDVKFMNEEDLILFTKHGMCIHFETVGINPIGRNTAGVKSIKLSDNDEVMSSVIVSDEVKTISIFSENGYGKKVDIREFPIQGRTGKGVICYKPSDVTGYLQSAVPTAAQFLIVGSPNSICIEEKDVPVLGRTSTGNIMIKESKIKKVICL